MANPSLIVLYRVLLVAAIGVFWQVTSHAQTPNYQPVIELGPPDYESGEPASQDAGRNVFLSMLSRAQTASQLAGSMDRPRVPEAMREAGVGVGMSNGASPVGDGLVGLLVAVLLVWYFSFRR